MNNRTFRSVMMMIMLLLAVSAVGFAAAQESTPEAAVAGAYLGVRIADAEGGVELLAVDPNVPAAAVLEVGDVITAVDGEAVADAAALAAVIATHAPGDTLALTLTRDGETIELDAELAELPAADPAFGRGGMRGRGGMGEIRGMMGLDLTYDADAQTLTLNSVSEDSPLYEAGLRSGDVITAVNGEPIAPNLMGSIMGSLGDDTAVLTVTVERDGATQDIEIPLDSLMGDLMGGIFGMMPGRDGRSGGMLPGFGFEMGLNGWLGVSFQSLDETSAAELGLDVSEGSLIIEVVADSPAETAGLLADDIVTAVNGEAVDAEHTLRDRLIAFEAGDTVTLTVLRAGEEQPIDVTLGEPTAGMGFGQCGGFFMNPRNPGMDGLPEGHPPVDGVPADAAPAAPNL